MVQRYCGLDVIQGHIPTAFHETRTLWPTLQHFDTTPVSSVSDRDTVLLPWGMS